MKARKRKLVKKPTVVSTPVIEKKLKKKKRKTIKNKPESPGSDSDHDPQTKIQTLLEPFSKDQLLTLVTDLSLSHDSLFALVKSAADKDVAHRKIFAHGLGWDATPQAIQSVFEVFGEIEDLNVVTDHATGKCKGYAFITFKNRKSAKKLLKNPRVTIGNRVATCQLASTKSSAASTSSSVIVSQQHFSSSATSSSDYPQRKIYVNNVPVNTNVGKLRGFFERFGEIESGPTGLDPTTGKFKGYAIFVFKTVEGAKKVLEEPFKVFEGIRLHCQKAAEGKSKVTGGAASITTALQPMQPQMMASLAAAQQAQNMALLGQQAGLVNPLYGGGMIGNANLAALMGGYYGMMGGQVPTLGLGAYAGAGPGAYAGVGTGAIASAGFGAGVGSRVGAGFGSSIGAGAGVGAGIGAGAGAGAGAGIGGGGGPSGQMFQGLQYMYPSMQSGQTSSSLAKASGTYGSGYSSNL
ncbi:hypothetical protein RD792_008613 [Penstemon davidsonii]|uniref:RRM domain-containing protein n=1 Tax=Penstemon davidsonii TaxID=160366 RepID=A0ABR0D9R8_9LAMI|nr:hypothetical protein RD792_008613 [Penstemon davidsonii]